MTVKRHWFGDSGIRLDASYHLSEGLITMRKLNKCPYPISLLKDETENIFKGGIFRRTYVDFIENGYEFITASEMMKSDISGGKFISKKYSDIDHLFVKNGWTLVSRSGTLGNTVYTSDIFKGKVLTDDLIRIVPNNKNVLSGYLYAFLTSHYGYGLLTQSGYGGVIQHIEPHHIENIPIPILPEETQQKIHSLIANASQLRVEANKLLKEAMEIFENYDVDGFTKIFKKKVSTLGFSWASYNNNVECDKIENSISEFLKIGDVATKCFAPPLFKHIYLDKDNGHPFLTGAELTKFNKKYYRWLSPRGVKNIEDYKVKKGTLLLYKSGTTDGGILGNVFIADDILDGACLSDHVIRIFTEDIKMSYWMFAFFKSRAGVKLLQKTATGSMIPFITPDRLQELKFPKPDDNFAFVTNNIEKYLEKTVQSQLSENQAIDLIEKEIDQWQQL